MMSKYSPSAAYREWLKEGCRMFSTHDEEAMLLNGVKSFSYLVMNDLEASFELVMGYNPQQAAAYLFPEYHPKYNIRKDASDV
jgi:hypothetical protein